MSKINSPKCSRTFLLLAMFLALPITFAPLQANIFESVAYAMEFGHNAPAINDYSISELDSLAGVCSKYPSHQYCQSGNDTAVNPTHIPDSV